MGETLDEKLRGGGISGERKTFWGVSFLISHTFDEKYHLRKGMSILDNGCGRGEFLHGLIGLTKYLTTYYAEKGVRVNALCPAGVYNGQDEEFLRKLTNLIPMGRMADAEEYKSTVLYLISNASSYMTGSTVVIDGGRTCW